jgi:hypothetical protein
MKKHGSRQRMRDERDKRIAGVTGSPTGGGRTVGGIAETPVGADRYCQYYKFEVQLFQYDALNAPPWIAKSFPRRRVAA